MRVLDRSVYVGPNLYAHFPVIRLEIDLGPLEEWPSKRLGPAFIDGLLAALPGLHNHGCSYREPGGFVRRLTDDEGTWMGHILEHVAIELQNIAGKPVTFGKTRSLGAPGRYYLVYEYQQAEVGLQAADLGLDLLHSLIPPELHPDEPAPPDFDFAAERDQFIRRAQRLALGPSTLALVRAAEERGIPWLRLNESSLIQLGYGRHQRRIAATITGQTPHIAVELASDKEATNRALARVGLPVPRQQCVDSVEEAIRAAERIGYPVVLKPYDANHGRGVTVGVRSEEQVRRAFDEARAHSAVVIVESQIEGTDHRLLVVNGRLVAASKRVPGHVVGDGVRTIEELVAEVNRDPRRGIGHEKVLTRIELDYQAERLLAQRGYDRQSVPPAGEVVYLRSTGNISTGGTAADVTDLVHPDNCDLAVRAANAIGLDVAGIDFLTNDIARSYKDAGGAICEVNAAPGLRMHLAPSEGQPRDVAGAIIDMLFPPGSRSTIPIAAITGTNGKTTTARMLGHIFRMAGNHVGLTSTDGVYINGRLTVEGDMTGPVATQMVLSDPQVDVAVLEVARGGLVRSGMGVPYCDVGAVLNVQSDHLGLRGVETLEDLAEVKRIVVEVARDTAVLNADDPRCLTMAHHTDARHLCYVTLDAENALVRSHVRAGGRGVVLENGLGGRMITLYEHGNHIPILWAHQIPATVEGRALHNVQNAMFAAAIAYSMGVSLEDVRQGLQTFDATFFQAPGRTNVIDDLPFKVILDYGHNSAAVEAMVRLVDQLGADGDRIVVVTCPGDRRDEDVRAIGRIVAGCFDHYVCRRDDDPRGRGPDEVPRLIRETLLEHGVPDEEISVIPDEQTAVQAALDRARPGDLVLIFADNLRRTFDQISRLRTDLPRRSERRRHPRPAGPAWNGRERRAYVRESRGVKVLAQGEQSD